MTHWWGLISACSKKWISSTRLHICSQDVREHDPVGEKGFKWDNLFSRLPTKGRWAWCLNTRRPAFLENHVTSWTVTWMSWKRCVSVSESVCHHLPVCRQSACLSSICLSVLKSSNQARTVKVAYYQVIHRAETMSDILNVCHVYRGLNITNVDRILDFISKDIASIFQPSSVEAFHCSDKLSMTQTCSLILTTPLTLLLSWGSQRSVIYLFIYYFWLQPK